MTLDEKDRYILSFGEAGQHALATIAKLTADNAALSKNLKALRTPTDMEEQAKDERDTARAEVAKLTADNAALRAAIADLDAARARLAEVEADRDRCVDACVFAASIFNLYASHHLAKGDHEKHARNNSYVERMRDAVNGRGAVGSLGELATVHAELARVKAEAEGLRVAARQYVDDAINGEHDHVETSVMLKGGAP